MNVRRTGLACALTYALAGCNASAEIGRDPCFGSRTRCEPPSTNAVVPEDGASLSVAPAALARLTPARSSPALIDGELGWYALAADRVGTLWEFAANGGTDGDANSGDGRLHVRATPLQGDPAESAISPPSVAGLSAAARVVQIHSPQSSERGPVVDVEWASCAMRQQGDCSSVETLAFGAGSAEAPERVRWNEDGHRAGPGFSAQAKGRWFTVDFPRIVEQRSRSLELIWRQTGLPPIGAALLLDTGELTLLTMRGTAPLQGAPDALWRIDLDGNVRQRLSIQSRLQTRALAHDTQGHVLLVGTDEDGSISVLRHDGDERIRSWAFLRTQYAPLNVFAVTVDLAGTLYALTESGERESQARVPVVCRVHEDDRLDCFVLALPKDTLTGAFQRHGMYAQATAPGVLHVGDAQQLWRYEFPSDLIVDE